MNEIIFMTGATSGLRKISAMQLETKPKANNF